MHIEWLSTLALQSKIPPNAAVFDLGPQDLWTEREPLRRVARRHLSPDACDTAIHEIFGDEAKPGSDAQRAFYSIFGGHSYRSLDLTDPRADYAYDLSYPLPDIGKYDVVTNFGTTEHVFNIGQSFENIHNLLNVGGLQLHTLPAYGYIDHGFYNIHPCAYLDMAKANEYEIVDFNYIDNINTRMARPIEDEPLDFGNAANPTERHERHARADDESADVVSRQSAVGGKRRPLEKLVGAAPAPPETACHGHKSGLPQMPDTQLPIFIMFDMIFVALRRTEKSPEKFLAPLQGIYARMQKQAG
jgi:hypothetical protein